MTTGRSQNGWVARSDTKLLTRCTAKLTGGTLLHFWAANADVGVIFTDFIERFDQTIERVAGPVLDDWSWADRPIRESTVTSNHASATAIDLNALKHPRKAHNTYSPEDRKKLRILVDSYDGVLRHGEFYAGTIDGMHCEINAGPLEVKRMADVIRARNAPKPTPPKDVAMALSPLSEADLARIAHAVWWLAQAEPLGQTAGGSLSEIDDRTLAVNLQLQARLGVDPLIQGLKETQTAQGLQLDEILTLLQPPT